MKKLRYTFFITLFFSGFNSSLMGLSGSVFIKDYLEPEKNEQGIFLNVPAETLVTSIDWGNDIDLLIKEQAVILLEDYISQYANTQVSHLLFNVNYLRACYDSDVMTPYWDIPDPDVNIPGQWAKFYWQLHKKGIDVFETYIAQSRAIGVSPWLSFRMNDAHHRRDTLRINRLMLDHPEFRISPTGGFDFARAEVREYFKSFIREALERYDVDGIEIDWMRRYDVFKPGMELQGIEILNTFMNDIRSIVDTIANARGHPIEIAVRVPVTPFISRYFGLDCVAWVKEGNVDIVIPSNFHTPTNFDIPVELWKNEIGNSQSYRIVPGADWHFRFNSKNSVDMFNSVETMRAFAISAYSRGAGAVYLFNHQILDLSKDILNTDAYSDEPRRHVLTYNDPDVDPVTWHVTSGFPETTTILKKDTEYDFNIYSGPKPFEPSGLNPSGIEDKGNYIVRVALAPKAGYENVSFDVRVNDSSCVQIADLPRDPLYVYGTPRVVRDVSETGARVMQFRADLKSVQDGYNRITISHNHHVEQEITWMEVFIKGFIYHFNEDTISNIPFGTRIDTLFWYLGKKPSKNWEIIFGDGVQRPDLKTGDKLLITNVDHSTREYYLKLNDYKKSSNAQLGAIYIHGDTLVGFKTDIYHYSELIPTGNDFPAISANPIDLNANVRIERPLNINGPSEHRTARIYVTAEDDTSFLLYTVIFEINREIEPFITDPIFSNVMNGVHIGTSASGWGKGFEIFNPGNTPVDMRNYLIANSVSGTLESIVSSKDMIYKMRPGYTIDSSRIHEGIYYKERPYPFNTNLNPGETLVFGRGSRDGWTTTNVFRDLCDYRDTNGDLDYAYNLYGFVDGARISFFANTNSLYLIRIDNDSVISGLKSADDPDDFTLADIFGTQGTHNNRIIEGIFVDHMSALCLVRKKEIWKGNPDNYGSFGTNESGSGEWEKYQGVMYIGDHPYTPYDGYNSTVYSLIYIVSTGYGTNQTIGLVPPGTSADLFMTNILPRVAGAGLTLTSSDGADTISGSIIIKEGDKLHVHSANTDNATIYTISIQQPSGDALLSSSDYTISVSDSSSLIDGIPAHTTVEDMLSKLTVPAGARLTVIDVNNQLVGTERVLFDTLMIVKTKVSDNIMLEVIAEDGITKIIYNISVTVIEPYVISDFYLVLQEQNLIDMFQSNTTVRTFLSRLAPSSGAGMMVVDKLGNVRGPEGIMYRDDQLLVSDGTKTTVYQLKDMFISRDASLKNLALNGITVEGFDPAITNYIVVLDQSGGMPPVPEVSAAANCRHASVTIIHAENLQGTEAQRTATIKVLADDGLTEIIYTILFDLNVGLGNQEEKLLNIYAAGRTIFINNMASGLIDEVEVFNMNGQRIIHKKITSSFESIELNYPYGIFIVKVQSAGKIYIEKLVLVSQ